MNQPRKSRSIKPTTEGIIKLKQAQNDPGDDRGRLTYEKIAENTGINAKTIGRFFQGEKIDRAYAQVICNALNLNINEIVDPKECNPPDPDKLEINWSQICRDILTEQQKKQRLRRQATELGCELNVYVPLGLLERKQQQRRDESVPKDDVYQLNPQVIVKEYENQQFLTEVIQGGNDQRLAIIGEPGAGKTTLLDKIASWIDKHNLGLPICIPLGGLQGETLAGYLLKIWLKQAGKIEATQENLAASLEQQFRSGKVWLLLDAVDEMAAASPAEALAKIRDELVGWVAEARVVLTCRLNVWDASVNNPLPGFKTYRTLEFKPEKVDKFIRDWFTEAHKKYPSDNCLSKGKKLLNKLKESNRTNIYKLVRNPLRLALLCQTFYLSPDEELPETQAMLYERFIRYFYEWKQEKHSTTRAQRQQLNQVLGELAKAGIESESRFRLRESWAIQLMGESQFKLAEELGWLNLVDRDAKTDEAVYAFFHPTFQEYFAAKAIEDWHFFLHHVPDNPKLGSYRIFERRWKEVMLLWVGRNDVLFEQKEGFIKALLEFDDGFEGKFYWYRAYFLAAAAITEFRNSSFADEIVQQIIEWSFGYLYEKLGLYQFHSSIIEGAREALTEADYHKAVKFILPLLDRSKYRHIRHEAIKTLGVIGTGNCDAIQALDCIIDDVSENNCCVEIASCSLGKITTGNLRLKAIQKIMDLMNIDPTGTAIDYLSQLVFESLDINFDGINFIVENMAQHIEKIDRLCSSFLTNWLIAKAFLKIAPTDHPQYPYATDIQKRTEAVINQLKDGVIDLLPNDLNILGLGDITEKDLDLQIIKILSHLNLVLRTNQDNKIQEVARDCLESILLGQQVSNQTIFLPLVIQGLKDCPDSRIRENYKVVWLCAQNLPYLTFYEAWHNSSTTLTK
ncbi:MULTISPECIES: NACHT domain-containing protein [Kamptonema]|uniref:NACHT domain-containing protein n=1 Tax=Kamptonema TaxID=1501433 RepID=UPI0001DACF83|nr:MULTISPECIES: NACHT domain-containing protein [Kamptonema]CBN58212.1 putative signal transduction protein with Nacht domain [Kamptonema sp. PCC 6506]